MSVYLLDGNNNDADLFHVLYTRDAAGRITTYNSSQAGQSFDYEYDYAGRLLFAHTMGTTDAAEAYTYDAGGNMLSNAAVGTYTYPSSLAPRPHTPTVVDGETLAYDANGNMTVGLGNKVITYDYNNRPTSVQFAGQTTAYTYGADGARQTKTVGATETFYAGIAEIRDFGGTGESIILQPHADFRITDVGGPNEAVSYLHRDHLSSVRMITNAAGTLEQSTAYTPYGDPDTTTLIAQSIPEEHSFIGERFDASTGLLYLNARYMDPALGRFIQPDWWEVRQPGVGTNRYAYSMNDPTNLSDRNGNLTYHEDDDEFLIDDGDTLDSIGKTMGLSVEEILAGNRNLNENSTLGIGDSIILPRNSRINAGITAIRMNNQERWSQSGIVAEGVPILDTGAPKCNQFVAACVNAGFGSYPSSTAYKFGITFDPTGDIFGYQVPAFAGQWARAAEVGMTSIPQSSAAFGDVVAWDKPGGTSGHTMIYMSNINIVPSSGNRLTPDGGWGAIGASSSVGSIYRSGQYLLGLDYFQGIPPQFTRYNGQ